MHLMVLLLKNFKSLTFPAIIVTVLWKTENLLVKAVKKSCICQYVVLHVAIKSMFSGIKLIASTTPSVNNPMITTREVNCNLL